MSDKEAKRARLLADLAELDRDEKTEKEERLNVAMLVYFAKEPLTYKIVSAIRSQLVPGKVTLMRGIDDHLYGAEQNIRYGDAVCFEFTNKRRREYQLAITVSNLESPAHNRVELRRLNNRRTGLPANGKYVKPLYWQSMFAASHHTEHLRECYLTETAVDSGFTPSMLPFDDDTNALFTAGEEDSDQLMLLDNQLLTYLLETAFAYLAALQAEGDHTYDHVIGTAIAHVYKKSI